MQHAVPASPSMKGTQLGTTLYLWLGFFGGPIVSRVVLNFLLSSETANIYSMAQPENRLTGPDQGPTNRTECIPVRQSPQGPALQVAPPPPCTHVSNTLFSFSNSPPHIQRSATTPPSKKEKKSEKKTCYTPQNPNFHQHRECEESNGYR